MSRWVIHARTQFSAHHALLGYRGSPETPHEHLWSVAIRVGTDTLNAEGYALDFLAVREILANATKRLAGSDFNQHPEIASPTPTAERLAEVLAGWLGPPLDELGGRLLGVSVWEGPENRVDLDLTAPA